jgi:DamX protein
MPDPDARERIDPYDLDTLGLHQQPFTQTTTFYQDQDREARLEIARGILRDGGTAVLAGDAGIGKSTFLRQLQRHATDLAMTIIKGHPQLRLPDIIEAMGAEGTEATPTAVWAMLRDAPTQPVVAIDNGEDLPGSVFKRLIRLQGALAENGLALPLIIACDRAQASSLTALLEGNRSSLVEIERVALSGLGALDTNAYLRLRLAEAGGDYSLLDDKQLARIHRRSGGNPGRIHVEAARELARTAARLRGKTNHRGFLNWASTPRAGAIATVAGTAVVAAAVTGWWLTSDGPQPTRVDAGDEVASASSPASRDASPSAPADNADQPASSSAAQGESPTQPGQADNAASTTVTDSPANTATNGTTPPSGNSQDNAGTASPSGADDPTTANGEAATSEATTAGDDEDAEPPPSDASNQETSERSEEAASADGNSATPADAAATEDADDSPGSTAPDGSAEGLALDRDWFGNQPGDHFTIQILGAREPSTVRRFMRQLEDPAETRVLPTRHNGDPWYVVVTGSYAERQAASAAIEGLDASWRAHDPFPRPFRSLRTPE